MSLKQKRNSYDAQFKLEVIKFAKENNNSAADKNLAVSEKLVRDIFIWNAEDEKDEALRS